jgi:hypothetical protein
MIVRMTRLFLTHNLAVQLNFTKLKVKVRLLSSDYNWVDV